MHLMMSGKERFVLRSRLLYGKCTSRNQKSAIMDDLMQYIGYKSRKHAITVLTQGQKKQKRKKKGRRKILDAQQVDFLREIWAAMGYPCAKLMHPMLQDWVEARKKSQDLSTEYSDVKLPKLSDIPFSTSLYGMNLLFYPCLLSIHMDYNYFCCYSRKRKMVVVEDSGSIVIY